MSISSNYLLTLLLLLLIVLVIETAITRMKKYLDSFPTLPENRSSYLQSFSLTAAIMAGVVIVLFELYVYQNYYDTGRYGIGGQMILIVVTVIVITALFYFAQICFMNTWISLLLALIVFWGSGILNLGLIASLEFRSIGESVALETQQTQDDVSAIAAKILVDTDSTFRIVVNGPEDYEASLSLIKFLHFASGSKDIQLEIPSGIPIEGLVKDLAEKSSRGDENYPIAPHRDHSSDKNTICVFVSNPIPYDWCEESTQVRWSLPL